MVEMLTYSRDMQRRQPAQAHPTHPPHILRHRSTPSIRHHAHTHSHSSKPSHWHRSRREILWLWLPDIGIHASSATETHRAAHVVGHHARHAATAAEGDEAARTVADGVVGGKSLRLGAGKESGAGLPGEGRDACVHDGGGAVVFGESRLDVVFLVEKETGFFVGEVLRDPGAASGLTSFEAEIETEEGCCDDECDD